MVATHSLMSTAIRMMPDFPLIPGLIDQLKLHSQLSHNSQTKWADYQRILHGGLFWWHPAVAFHVLYTKSYAQMEARLIDILKGISIGDLGELSEAQLRRLDALEKEGARMEEWITQGLRVAHAAPVWDHKVAMVKSFTILANDLRRSTLDGIDAILTPLQRTHFRASGMEMDIRIHEWLIPTPRGS